MSEALNEVLGFNQVQVSGHLANIWSLPDPLAEAMAHYPETDYQGNQLEVVNIAGVASMLVSAFQKTEPCSLDDPRLPSLNLTNKEVTVSYEQLTGQLEKLKEIAKLLSE